MERESFVFYRSFYNSLKNLSLEDRDNLCMTLFEYALNGVEPELDGYLLSMFDLIKPQIDANNKRYVDGCKGGEYGRLGGRPPKTWDNSQKPHPNPTLTPHEPQVNPTETPNDNDNDNVNDNDNENEKILNNTSYYLTDESELNEGEMGKTKLDGDVINNDVLRNNYAGISKRKGTLKDLEKVTKSFGPKEFGQALTELHLLQCEYKLRPDDITSCSSLANAVAKRDTDEEKIQDRVNAIVKGFSTFKHRTPQLKEKRDNNVKIRFKDYLPKEESKTTLDWVLEYDGYNNANNTGAFLEKYGEGKYATIQARRLEYTSNGRHPLKSWQN